MLSPWPAGSLHRPVATRHPWPGAPFCGHPDRAPIRSPRRPARQTARAFVNHS